MVMATATSATTIRSGDASSMSCSGRSTRRARSCSSIGRVPRFPFTNAPLVWQASLFVAVLGASSYTYAEATCDQQMESWIQAHVHAFEFYGGVTSLIVP